MGNKKYIVLIIVLTLLLSACSTVSPDSSNASGETNDVVLESQNGATQGTTATEGTGETGSTESTQGTGNTEGTEPTTPTTGNTEATEGGTEPPATEPPATTPPVTEPPATKPPVTEPPTTTPPATTPPATTKPTTPATPSRPTSSATSRDTGSNTIWVDPDVSVYEETDPRRTEYIRTNTHVTTIYEQFGYHTMLGGYGGLQMFIGHTYGMPFMHEGDISDLQWVSSNTAIATVNDVGLVTPLREGEVEIGFYDQHGTYYRRKVTVYTELKYTEAELEQMAKVEAKAIADYIMNELALNSDLERIAVAAQIVQEYVKVGKTADKYEIIDGEIVNVHVPGYNRPFGTLITKRSSCAGSTRALGLILEYMGFEWYHVNANQWDHQWCVVYDVDGKTAFADGTWAGVAGYGSWQTDKAYEYDANSGLVPYNGPTPFM